MTNKEKARLVSSAFLHWPKEAVPSWLFFDEKLEDKSPPFGEENEEIWTRGEVLECG